MTTVSVGVEFEYVVTVVVVLVRGTVSTTVTGEPVATTVAGTVTPSCITEMVPFTKLALDGGVFGAVNVTHPVSVTTGTAILRSSWYR